MTEFRMRCYVLGTLTDELRKELKRVGYKDENGVVLSSGERVEFDKYGYITATDGVFMVNIPNVKIPYAIDCGDNVDLFLALAYLRFDSDINQWFTDGEHWHIYTGKEVIPDDYHKASVIEIIKHFA